jgi:hypothetical protein
VRRGPRTSLGGEVEWPEGELGTYPGPAAWKDLNDRKDLIDNQRYTKIKGERRKLKNRVQGTE